MENYWILVLICGSCAAISVTCPQGNCFLCADLLFVLSHTNLSNEASEASTAASDDEPVLTDPEVTTYTDFFHCWIWDVNRIKA